MDHLDLLRQQLTAEQRACLNAIWEDHRQKNRWIPCRVLHALRRDKLAVCNALEPLGGSVVVKQSQNGTDCYQLTFLGVLLTEHGDQAECLLVRYLEYVRDQFLANPELEMLTGSSIDSALGLDTDERIFMQELVRLGQFYGRHGGFGSEGWSVAVPEDVDDLPSISDLRSFIRQRAVQHYDPDIPLTGLKTAGYYLTEEQLRASYTPSTDAVFGSTDEPGQERARRMEWDVFICHASEDKRKVAKPLARTLQGRGLAVWYDEWNLTIGDSLRRSIDRGLARSRFGVVVLSPHFFDKGWPQIELDGLVELELQGRKVILPIWHQVDHRQVARYSPSLAGRVAGSTKNGITALADQIVRAIAAQQTDD